MIRGLFREFSLLGREIVMRAIFPPRGRGVRWVRIVPKGEGGIFVVVFWVLVGGLLVRVGMGWVKYRYIQTPRFLGDFAEFGFLRGS